MSGEAQRRAERLVGAMMRRDGFSAWLGVEIVEIAPARSVCRLRVRDDMLNGFGVCHGGIAYSLADSALAFASNTHGTVTVSIENSIAYPAPVRAGDVLTATAEEEGASKRLAFYRVTVRNQEDATVALFRGTVYRTEKPLETE
ncbi:MAG TPA: hydroxyphenylacetyl-CoA thioesterase PaaI [Gemmatimonadaceae bacterium]|nr:hydroxyphenylacetyl-CoA thioesterase PaaI [Gemmatimonadaceae bacterium]